MSAPWAASIEDGAAVSLIAMVRGTCHIVREGLAPIGLGRGDVAVITGPMPYVIADSPATQPSIVIEPGQVCRSLGGEELSLSWGLGVRTWGNGPNGDCVFLTAAYELASQVTGRLLDAVRETAVVRAADWDGALVDLLTTEMQRDLPGQDVVLDRLADILLVSALRQWFARAGADAPRWWRAQSDPVVGTVLHLMHDRPAEPWTLDRLAIAAAVSRATLARRFARQVGQSPMAYLADWRLTCAADLLRSSEATVEQIARQVGYVNPFAFTAAFKKRSGLPPRAFRNQVGAPRPHIAGTTS